MNVLCKSQNLVKVYDPSNGLTSEEIGRIERYLDAVRSNIMFAKGVVLVEGDAEQILIPALVKAVLGITLDEIGVSLINIGSTGFKNLATIFHQDRINKYCSIVTDLDESMVELSENEDDDTEEERACRNSQTDGAERKVALDEFAGESDFINVYYADNTFEVQFLQAGNILSVMGVVNSQYKRKTDKDSIEARLNDPNIEVFGREILRLADKFGKGWFALLIAEQVDYTTRIPRYILEALAFACPSLGTEAVRSMCLKRTTALYNNPIDGDETDYLELAGLIRNARGKKYCRHSQCEIARRRFDHFFIFFTVLVMSISYKDLNSEQLAAVNAGGNVLITACPGSGKTRVLTHKLAFELEKLQSIKRWLVALTFTNRAADEIKRRIDRLSIPTENLWTGTIHSFCLEWVIRPYGGYLPQLKAGFSISDEVESEEIIDQLKSKYGVNKFTNIKRIYTIDGGFDTNERRFLPLIQEYKDIIHADRKIDFDDILYFSYKLIKTQPIIAFRLSGLFELICVDEYQDTQELQYSILAEIIKSKRNKTRIFFVGDVCQAIYGSIGGIAKSRTQIDTQFGGIGISHFTLTGNYRSTQRMVDYYSNYQVEKMEIQAVSSIADQIGTISHDVEIQKDEVHIVISKLIRQAIDQGIPAREICVMAPQWWMILPMGRKLKSMLPDIDFNALGLSPFRKVRENTWFRVIRLF